MDLSPEDSLRLNVLLTQSLQALRIDESRMIVFALTDRGEAKVELHANCQDAKYIRHVKSLFSSYSLGSPGGYPVYLKRWTRMGQAKDESLQQLLLLGEEEAVVAVVHAPGITDELARRAWWSMPTSDNARRMLENKLVIQGEMGGVLAEFLIEHLPFEEDQLAIIDSVKVALQPGLIAESTRDELWHKAKMKSSFCVGFLQSVPDALPGDEEPHNDFSKYSESLTELQSQENKVAILLLKIMGASGQKYLNAIELALKRPGNQDVVVALFMAIEKYFSDICPGFQNKRDINDILNEAEVFMGSATQEISEILLVLPECKAKLQALLVLSAYCEILTFPVFGQTDAIGSVMRKKIKHLTDPLKQQLNILRN